MQPHCCTVSVCLAYPGVIAVIIGLFYSEWGLLYDIGEKVWDYNIIQNIIAFYVIAIPGYYIREALAQHSRFIDMMVYDKQLEDAIMRAKKIYYAFVAIAGFVCGVFLLSYYVPFIGNTFASKMTSILVFSRILTKINMKTEETQETRDEEVVMSDVIMTVTLYLAISWFW